MAAIDPFKRFVIVNEAGTPIFQADALHQILAQPHYLRHRLPVVISLFGGNVAAKQQMLQNLIDHFHPDFPGLLGEWTANMEVQRGAYITKYPITWILNHDDESTKTPVFLMYISELSEPKERSANIKLFSLVLTMSSITIFASRVFSRHGFETQLLIDQLEVSA